jgi:hypothetical protein
LPRLDSIVAHESLENNRHSAGSGRDQFQKLPVATAPGIVKSVSGLKHIHH